MRGTEATARLNRRLNRGRETGDPRPIFLARLSHPREKVVALGTCSPRGPIVRQQWETAVCKTRVSARGGNFPHEQRTVLSLTTHNHHDFAIKSLSPRDVNFLQNLGELVFLYFTIGTSNSIHFPACFFVADPVQN